MKNKSNMHRLTEYSIESVRDAYMNKKFLDNRKIKKSQRLDLFFAKGVTCIDCGLEANIFVLETHDINVKPHLNLYHKNIANDYIVFTKDHIVPKSLGGSNTLENYQTMCGPCNFRKGNSRTY